MKYLRITSWIIALTGVVIIAAASFLNLQEVWVLGGILLLWAGIVKIAVVLIWEKVAGMGTSDHSPTPAP